MGARRDERATRSTPDDEGGRYIVVDGRRWRATDPSIPEPLRAALVHELMAARRAVKHAKGDESATASARRRVQDAKVALGERGAPWWEPAPVEAQELRITAAARALLRHRQPDATICPSEVARVVGGEGWRACMDQVRDVGARLAAGGEVVVRQRGEAVDATSATGPIRYGRGERFPDGDAP